jgi:hypothetical protein
VWCPHSGGTDEAGASVENARAFVSGLVSHLQSMVGTPRMPGKSVDTFSVRRVRRGPRAGEDARAVPDHTPTDRDVPDGADEERHHGFDASTVADAGTEGATGEPPSGYAAGAFSLSITPCDLLFVESFLLTTYNGAMASNS